MADDPAFLFYPGDYLKDTQCLGEKAQVAYDRIICEHMRNICISQQQLKFFTKRLNDDECTELFQVLTKVPGGFQIKWVADSILKRREYSESRRKNREGKSKKSTNTQENICGTYVPHMENAIENVIENINTNCVDFSKPDIEGDEIVFPLDNSSVRSLWSKWKESRFRNHKARYKIMGEQAALKRLQGMTYQQIESTILTAISGGWLNLYPDKSKQNGERPSKSQQHANDLIASHAARWGNDSEAKAV